MQPFKRTLRIGWAVAAVGLMLAEHVQAAAEPTAEGHHGLSPAPPILFHIGPFPITNSIVVSWIVTIALITIARLATRKMQLIPSGLQNFVEWVVESLFSFLESILGHKLTLKTFWYFASVFIFILAANWFGLIPGVGTIGYGYDSPHGFILTKPLLRGATADLNLTFALAMIFFVFWLIWSIRANGVAGFISHLFGPRGDVTGALKIFLGFIFFVVGILEVISILFRPVSLSFRLYGNIFAGENMLEAMTSFPAPLSWVIPLPFYFLEILVGFIQATVFMLLTAIFTMVSCSYEESH